MPDGKNRYGQFIIDCVCGRIVGSEDRQAAADHMHIKHSVSIRLGEIQDAATKIVLLLFLVMQMMPASLTLTPLYLIYVKLVLL